MTINDTPLRILLNFKGVDVTKIEILYHPPPQTTESPTLEDQQSKLTVYCRIRKMQSVPDFEGEYYGYSYLGDIPIRYSHVVCTSSLSLANYKRAKKILDAIIKAYERILNARARESSVDRRAPNSHVESAK